MNCNEKFYRPWGFFFNLIESEDFKVKVISVDPHSSLSLQSHDHRDETWVVVQGISTVTLDKDVKRLRKGEVVSIPRGSKHRIQNGTDSLVVLIEVQIGDYFGEDDIVRYEDNYGRIF